MLSITLITLFLSSAVWAKVIVPSKHNANTPNAIVAGKDKSLSYKPLNVTCKNCKDIVSFYIKSVRNFHPKNSTIAVDIVCYSVIGILEWGDF